MKRIVEFVFFQTAAPVMSGLISGVNVDPPRKKAQPLPGPLR